MVGKKCIYKDGLCCEAIFRIAPDNHYIIISQCGGTKEPSIENKVYIFHSFDKGKSWTKPKILIENNKAQYQTEVTIFGNKILVFMTEHDGNFTNFHSYIMVSEDNGMSFSVFNDKPLLDGFYFIRGAIKFKDHYLLPFQQYIISKEENDKLVENKKMIWDSSISDVKMGVLITTNFTDFKISQKPCSLPLTFNGKKKWVWSEPTIAKISSESILMLLRNDARGFLYKSVSHDNGDTWTPPIKTLIPNPANKPKLIEFESNLILLNTPKSTNGYSYRNPLSLWISKDNGETWFFKKDIIKKKGWISYPDGVVLENEKKLLFAFEYNRKQIYYVSIKLPRIN